MGSIENTKQQGRKLPWTETPLIESASLSQTAGCRIFLKLENHQPSGSFKSRGIGNLVLSYASDPANQGKRLHFFIVSAGNAGLGAASAASSLSYPCTVFVPTNTKPIMAEKLRKAGAEVVVHGTNLDEAAVGMKKAMKELASKGKTNGSPNGSNSLHSDSGCSCCNSDDDGGDKAQEIVPIELHPFDRHQIWEGVSTMVDELAYQLPAVDDDYQKGYTTERRPQKALPADAIVCSVGGGGLMNGILLGVERQSRMYHGTPGTKDEDKIHIIATETTGANALAASVNEGKLTTIPKITSMAASLGALRVAEKTYNNAVSPPAGTKVDSLVLTDADAARGSLRLAEEHKILVELACGVSVEAALGSPKAADGHPLKSTQSYLQQMIPNFGPQTRVVIVVCGGSNVSVDMAAEWHDRLDNGWD